MFKDLLIDALRFLASFKVSMSFSSCAFFASTSVLLVSSTAGAVGGFMGAATAFFLVVFAFAGVWVAVFFSMVAVLIYLSSLLVNNVFSKIVNDPAHLCDS